MIFSFAMGFVAGFVTLITASGGTDNPARLDLGLIAFGIGFIATLLVISMLHLASRENPEELAEGSGVNRNSEELYRQQVATRREAARRKKADEAAKARREAGEPEGDDEPTYGRRNDRD
nr:cbb3-type cytochrome c oxidase subunit I [Nesterenkonia sp. E16_10]